ncbi:MAG: hypothetical protein U0930_24260 [Pirellulales bacterium]
MPALDLIDHIRLDKSVVALIESMPALTLNLESASDDTSLQVRSVIKQMHLEGTCAEAGLWLLARQWDRSHQISQDQHNPDGSYWHGIMHRIEGDYWNSKYWLRQTSKHPVRIQLVKAIGQRADQLIQSEKSSLGSSIPDLTLLNSPETVAEGLVDLVEKALAKQTGWSRLAEQICWWEWQLLFQYSLTGQV